MKFFVGLHIPSHAHRFDRCMVSVNRLRGRVSDFDVGDWMMDSGAFTEVTKHRGFRFPPEEYAAQVRRWAKCGNLLAAAGQDWMCEPFALEATGASVAEHQRWTVERYDAVLACNPGAYILPVLQGWHPEDYASHVRQYGDRLHGGAWVGVGSVCKRNTDVGAVEAVLRAILAERADLRLHGFGLKLTALRDAGVRDRLYSSDSMAWSWAARMNGGNANDWREAMKYTERVNGGAVQTGLFP